VSQHKIINDCTENSPDQEAKYDDNHRFLDGSPSQRHFQSSSALRITSAAGVTSNLKVEKKPRGIKLAWIISPSNLTC
jgi:hypothetical protein